MSHDTNAMAGAPAWEDCRNAAELVKLATEVLLDGSGGGLNAWRGEHRRFPTACKPSIARKYATFSRAGTATNLTVEERTELEDFIGTAPETVDARFGPAATHNPTTPGWWAFAQHRGRPTRLLDVTANPLVALFFATELGADDDDGFVFGLHVPGRLDTESQQVTYLNCFDWDLRPGTVPWVRFEVSEPNDWMLAQAGGFAWCPTIGESWNGGVIKIRVPAEEKAKIRAQLALIGITKERLFPPEMPAVAGLA